MRINEQTLIPISMLVAILGGSGYVTFVAFQGTANADAIKRIEQRQDMINEIRIDVQVIKSKLDRIDKKLDQGE